MFCVSIDVERDYRLDGRLSSRGLDEGLPPFLDVLRSHRVPFDLMISGEVLPMLPQRALALGPDVALGCHGFSHVPGYLNRMQPARQEQDLKMATDAIGKTFGRSPRLFRAPNFSADARTIQMLNLLGYDVDSSVLPGRVVRRWRILTLVDHRGAPHDPYATDSSHFPKPGGRSILEVPVTPNPILPGGPLGLGFLHSHGVPSFLQGLHEVRCRCVVFLAHSWEMVRWTAEDPVAPWVRSASTPDTRPFEELLSAVDDYELMNLANVNMRERTALTGSG